MPPRDFCSFFSSGFRLLDEIPGEAKKKLSNTCVEGLTWFPFFKNIVIEVSLLTLFLYASIEKSICKGVNCRILNQDRNFVFYIVA